MKIYSTMLYGFRFLDKWTNWMMALITTTSFLVLVNDISGDIFRSERDIR